MTPGFSGVMGGGAGLSCWSVGAASVDGADSEMVCEEARHSWPWDDHLLGPTLCPRLQCGHSEDI